MRIWGGCGAVLAGVLVGLAGCGGHHQRATADSPAPPSRPPLWAAQSTVQRFVNGRSSRVCADWVAAAQRDCHAQARELAALRARHAGVVRGLRYRASEQPGRRDRVEVMVATADAAPGVPTVVPHVFLVAQTHGHWRILREAGPPWRVLEHG